VPDYYVLLARGASIEHVSAARSACSPVCAGIPASSSVRREAFTRASPT